MSSSPEIDAIPSPTTHVRAERAPDAISNLPPAEITRTPRILSVDMLRGITVAFMIMVNNAGDWGKVYEQLDHAPWNGWTLTDLVFPTFLFVVGASLVYSLAARMRKGDSTGVLILHVVSRSAKIFLLDLIIAAYPYTHLSQLRIYGVLTRIALCYLVAGLILIVTRNMRVLAALAATILAGYWAIMRFVPVPGFGVPGRDVPFLDKTGNLVAWIDRGINAWFRAHLHTGVLYQQTRDPEGLLSTLPAVATVLIGALAALWLRQHADRPAIARNGLLLGGVASFCAGIFWGHWFPINKNLWTSSYVLMAAGWALTALGIFYWLIDVKRLREKSRAARWLTTPALIFGSNAITAYALSMLLPEILFRIQFHEGARITNVWGYIYEHLYARGHSTEMSSLAFAVSFVAVCFVCDWLLYRRRIFVKI